MSAPAYGPIFSRGLSNLCSKIFRQHPQKNAMLTCKITLPDSPHPVIISKNPGFRELYLNFRILHASAIAVPSEPVFCVEVINPDLQCYYDVKTNTFPLFACTRVPNKLVDRVPEYEITLTRQQHS